MIVNFFDFINESNSELPESVEKFLAQFPDDSDSWADAGDELRDLCREIRELYNNYVVDVLEDDPKALKPLNFRKINSPQEWIKKSKDYIRTNFAKLNKEGKEEFLDNDWFK